jgi:glycosyltransferase involved in cell wall biosynthesis
MPVVLQVGTSYNKNILRVAEALSGIPCHLRIIGNVSEEHISQLTSFNINYSSISNLTDADIISEYINCDALIFASTYEGFGMPIIEANAIGRPVVTSNVLSMPEVAGDAACLVDPFDVTDIKRGLLQIFTDEGYRNTLIANGYVNAKRFNPSTIAAHYARVYREIISSNNC